MEWGNRNNPIPSPWIIPPAITSPFFCMICFISYLQLDNHSLHNAYSVVGGFMNGILLSLLSRSEEHTSELQSRGDLLCLLLLEKKKLHINRNSFNDQLIQ